MSMNHANITAYKGDVACSIMKLSQYFEDPMRLAHVSMQQIGELVGSETAYNAQQADRGAQQAAQSVGSAQNSGLSNTLA